MTNFSDIFNQSNCLSRSQLLNYIRQKLDRDEVYLVESHLNDCSFCSDALDGLIEENPDGIDAQLFEIKKEVETKISSLHPIEKTILVGTKSQSSDARKIKSGGSGKPQRRYRWMVAASILLIMGLGGYSIFSYIKSQDHQLSKNENAFPSESSKAEYKTLTDQHSNEINQIKITPPKNEVPVQQTVDGLKKNLNVTPVQDDVAKQEAMSNPPSTPIVSLKESTDLNEKLAKDIRAKNLNKDEEVAAYMADKETTQPQEARLSKKQNAGGLSNSKPAALNQRSNQLNYPAQQNNASPRNEGISNNDNYESKKSEVAKSNYNIALQYYNAGEYKNSISYFERALKGGDRKQKEDIEFQLADAYQKSGMNRKARKLLEELAAGGKYQQQAEEKLQQTRK